jgi:preprotein translocase subunit SecB
MSSLPLVVERHFFTKVLVEANPDHQPEKDKDHVLGIRAEVRGGSLKDDPRRWRLFLTVRTETSEEEKIPYKIDLECVGFFTVSPEVEEKKIPSLVHANGAAILYSSTREFLLVITGRGPWGGFYLPTTNFLKPPKPKEEEEPGLSKPVPKIQKKKRKTQPVKPASEGVRMVRFKSKDKKTLDQPEGEPSES